MENFVSQYVMPWAINIAFAWLIFFAGRAVARVLCRIADSMMTKSGIDQVIRHFLITILHSLLLLFVVIAALRELGLDTTSLVALVGAAGLAVGLALQGSLQNFAAGVMLIVFRPFTAGDFVDAGGVSGVVERITIFSTYLRTGDNKQIIVPNGSIFNGNIVNYSAKDTRRIDLVLGIGYGDDLAQAKQIIEKILNEEPRILDDPAPAIALAELAESSVNLHVRPWVKSDDYWPVRADVLERVKLAFDEAGVTIPYPQMDVHLSRDAA